MTPDKPGTTVREWARFFLDDTRIMIWFISRYPMELTTTIRRYDQKIHTARDIKRHRHCKLYDELRVKDWKFAMTKSFDVVFLIDVDLPDKEKE